MGTAAKMWLVVLSLVLTPFSKNVEAELQSLPSPSTKVEVVTKVKYIFVKPYANVKGIDSRLEAALSLYEGPSFFISSCVRKHDKKSKHSKGLAIDVTLKKEIVKFLESEEGVKWLNQFNLSYYVEFSPKMTKDQCKSYNFYKNRKTKNLWVNPNASGPHIHIYLK